MVLAAVGAGLAIPATVVAAIGLETALSAWNDEMGLLPWGLARILGITVYLEIPADTARGPPCSAPWSRGRSCCSPCRGGAASELRTPPARHPSPAG